MDWAIGTRGSLSPTNSSVGVVAFAMSLIGELFQYVSMGAFFCHGEPPNHTNRRNRSSVWAYIDTQFATPAPADAALKRDVIVISLLVRCAPALQPMSTIWSGFA